MSRPRPGVPFFLLALAFIALGLTSNRVFLYLGVVFLVIAVAPLLRRRR